MAGATKPGYLARVPALLTILSAMLYAASFPPLELWPLAWVALAPLLVAATRVRPLAAALHGVLWAYAVCLLIGWPLAGMLSRHFSFPLWLGWIGFVVLVALLVAIHVAAFAAWLAWLSRRGRAGPLAVASGWVASEYLRLHLSGGIPWAFSGYSQVPLAP